MPDNKNFPYGIPKRDGSGRGIRLNRNRGGCYDSASIPDKDKRDNFMFKYVKKWIESFKK